MPKIDRTALIHAIKDAIGRLDDDGNEVVGRDEVSLSVPVPPERRPISEKIKAIAREMAQDELREPPAKKQ